MGALIDNITADRSRLIKVGGVGILVVISTTLLFNAVRGDDRGSGDGRSYRQRVKRVRNGHKVKLSSEETLIYAGIRAPYAGQPFFEQSLSRNEELVKGKKVRLRFDDEDRDREGHLKAYVFADGLFVNEILVREGLAYARLTPGVKRFADRILKAQNEARKKRRGLWKKKLKSSEANYPASIKHAAFHRPSCAEVPNIKLDQLRVFDKKPQAFDAGFAPCSKCSP